MLGLRVTRTTREKGVQQLLWTLRTLPIGYPKISTVSSPGDQPSSASFSIWLQQGLASIATQSWTHSFVIEMSLDQCPCLYLTWEMIRNGKKTIDALACPPLEVQVQSHPNLSPLVSSDLRSYTLFLPDAVSLLLTSPLIPFYSNLTVVLQMFGCPSASLNADKDALGHQPFPDVPQWHAGPIFHGLLASREAFPHSGLLNMLPADFLQDPPSEDLEISYPH